MTTTPDYVPEHLRPHYSPPGPDDHAFFAKSTVERVHYLPGGQPHGVPEVFTIYDQAQEWARQRLASRARWAEYLAHQNELEPVLREMPPWLQDAPVTPHVRSQIFTVLQSDWERRHRYPHPDHQNYMDALWDEADTMTEHDVRHLWDQQRGIPRAQQQHDAARRAEEEARAAAQRQLHAESARRAQEHADLEAAALARLDRTLQALETAALDHLDDLAR